MPYAHVREATVDRDGQVRVEGLPLRAGERVQVFVISRQNVALGADRYPLQGHPIRYDALFEPAIDPEEWEANP